jgi:hypothetical protein
MVTKRVLIVAVLATFCLTATLFMIVPTRSQTSSYSARTDVNGDGTIDMADLSWGIDGFMTNGDPTLPVNITGHATKLIVAATGDSVPASSWWIRTISVDGYSKVSFNIFFGATANFFRLWTNDGAMSFQVEIIPNFANYLVKTYDVANQYVTVEIYNAGGSAANLWIDAYLVA